MTLGGFILGLIFMIIGFIFVWKTEWFMINFGRIGFAEEHLGTEGGSRLVYKLIGILMIMFGIMYGLNLTRPIMLWLVKIIT